MKSLVLFLAVVGFVGSAYAEETTGEKMEKTGHDAKRSMKKGMHKTEEALCADGDAKCAAKKVKHRGQEAGDYAKDKTNEALGK